MALITVKNSGLWYGITRRLIFCRRGLFRGNTLIGVATVKLLPLETKCTLHNAFDVSPDIYHIISIYNFYK